MSGSGLVGICGHRARLLDPSHFSALLSFIVMLFRELKHTVLSEAQYPKGIALFP